MKNVHKSVLIWYSTAEMFALVTDVTHYPQFLPWCETAQVISSSDTHMTAELGLSLSGIKQAFTTENHHIVHDDHSHEVHMKLIKGPFSHLDGHWQFTPLVDANANDPHAPPQRACKIEFDLNYAFSSNTLAALVGPIFDKIAGSLVDAFVKRAEQVYQ